MSFSGEPKAQTHSRPTTVWKLYNGKARARDKALMKDWVSSINSLLLFAAIFAAVLTALCVESRKLLEPEPLSSVQYTLLQIAYLSQRSFDPSAQAPPPEQPFQPPGWAVLVNGLFFTSLTTSILAAVGAVTCLQWVEEYDAGLEAAATPKERAIRSHYRYRATENWYMRHMIASLPIIIYIAVGFFFVGLMLWFWQSHQLLALIPLAGFLVWLTGYIATTLMAVFYPSAPYRTALSKALFRGLFLTAYYARKGARAIILCRSVLKFLLHFFFSGKHPWNESRNQFILDKLEFSRQMKTWSMERYPWMAPGRHVRQAMHAHIREQGRVSRDDTIHISTLAWLASSIDLSEYSIPNLYLVLTAINEIPDNKLLDWPAQNYDAPWSHIFNMVLKPDTRNEALKAAQHRDEILLTLAQLLQKMSRHPILFERMIHDLDGDLLVVFIRLLASKPLRNKMKSQNRLKSITSLLSSKRWADMNTQEQPVMHIFKIVLDCLDSMQSSATDHGISASWILTLCHKETIRWDDEQVLKWPKPELIRFIPNAFDNQILRENAIVHLLLFIDAVLSNTESPADTRQQWRWNRNVVIQPDSGPVVMRLLVRHVLRIFFTFEQSRRRQSRDLFNGLLAKEHIRHPALRLIVVAFGAHQEAAHIPPGNAIWDDPAWQYAVAVWYGFETTYNISSDTQVSRSVPPDQSQCMIRGLRSAKSQALHALIDFSAKSHSSVTPFIFWVTLLQSVHPSEVNVLQDVAYQMVGLHPEQWFYIFVNFHSKEASDAKDITAAMLTAIRTSLRKALFRRLWQRGLDRKRPNAPPRITKFVQVVNLALRKEKETSYRNSGSLSFGMLELIRDRLRIDHLYASENSVSERTRAYISLADGLALTYTGTNLRDGDYTRLFFEISQALGHTRTRFIIRHGHGQQFGPKHESSDGNPDWSAEFQATLAHLSTAAGINDVPPPPKLGVSRFPLAGNMVLQMASPVETFKETFLRGPFNPNSNTKPGDQV